MGTQQHPRVRARLLAGSGGYFRVCGGERERAARWEVCGRGVWEGILMWVQARALWLTHLQARALWLTHLQSCGCRLGLCGSPTCSRVGAG